MGDKIVLRGGPLDGASFDRADLDRVIQQAPNQQNCVIRFTTLDGRSGVYQPVDGQWVYVGSVPPPGFTRPNRL